MSYKIVRRFQETGRRYTLGCGLTLEEAQAHCSDPNTSWKTCTKKSGKDRTRKHGMWFDTYEKE